LDWYSATAACLAYRTNTMSWRTFAVENPISTKLLPLVDLAAAVARHKAEGRRIAHCHGVFDVLHPGHVRHLKVARDLADILVVTITADRFVNKGPGRPAFNESLRAEFLSSITAVDYVGISHAETAVELIKALKPDFYVKGSDYVRRGDDPTGQINDEEQAVLAVGGQMCFTDEIVFSSSHLINTHFDVFPPEVESWLGEFRRRRTADEVLGWLERASKLKVTVVGEPIIDEYSFCEGLGKSSKDPILAFLHRSLERYAGGSLAVANHVAGLGCTVNLVGQLGETNRCEDFIRERLAPSVEAIFTTRRNAPTIAKRRFVDAYTGIRLFEIYFMDERGPSAADAQDVRDSVRRASAESDVVIAADYGHGMIAGSVVDELVESSAFLVVNTQANAGNRGFNTISKYPRADYVCLANHEAELEARAMHASWHELVAVLANRVKCQKFTITRGRAGTVHCTVPDDFHEAPALATQVTDRVGAGDAVLALTGPLVAVDAPWDIVAFLGNLAGAQMVADLGNRSTLNRVGLTKAVQALLK